LTSDSKVSAVWDSSNDTWDYENTELDWNDPRP
jgi:hypothetical protein